MTQSDGQKPRFWTRRELLGTALVVTIVTVTACGTTTASPPSSDNNASPAGQSTVTTQVLSGDIKLDGSSTVFPISEAVAEEFQKIHPKTRVTVGISGTGGGFSKFCNGETDISDASRLIKDTEKDACQKNGIEWLELPVAYDGLSILVNPKNTWVDAMTVAELKKIWEPDSQVKKWNQIRPEWPDREINLYGPGTDSGTFDYFTEAINGKEKASRSDFTASEDDNVLVQGIAGDQYALGYFGYAYYAENRDKLKLVAVDGGSGPILPSEQTINDGTYKPLSRLIYIYPKKASLQKAETAEYVKFYLTTGVPLVKQVGYVPLPQAMYAEGLKKLEAALK